MLVGWCPEPDPDGPLGPGDGVALHQFLDAVLSDDPGVVVALDLGAADGPSETDGWSFASPGSGPANPSKAVYYWVGTTGTGIPASEGTPFIVGQSAPNPVIFARLHGPAQTCLNDLTPAADCLCLFDLAKCRTGVPDGEEQLGILI